MKYETPLLVIQMEYEDVIRTSPLGEGDDFGHQDDY